MDKTKKIYKHIRNTLSVVFLVFSSAHASSMKEEIASLPPSNSPLLIDPTKAQDEWLEQVFDENREAMEQANSRAKRRLKIDASKRPYHKK